MTNIIRHSLDSSFNKSMVQLNKDYEYVIKTQREKKQLYDFMREQWDSTGYDDDSLIKRVDRRLADLKLGGY